MQTDPVEEWRRLSALYSEMGDAEIQELVDQINDLTPTAQEALRDQVKKRGLSARDPRREFAQRAQAALENEESDAADRPYEYSWKVRVFEGDDLQRIRQLAEVLSRAGMERWVERGPSGEYLVLVAADQADEAKELLAQPIPQDIIDQLNEEATASEYELPTCPKCYAPDPILESVEPSNNWLCESCGHTWSDPAVDKESPAAPD
jgi:hypothetical protein